MSKLGLKITKAYNGLTVSLVENDSPSWEKYVRDIREDCKHINGLEEGSGKSVILYTSTQVGEIYTIASYIPGRGSDLISAWIYCPLDVDIPGDELSGIIEATRQEILANRLNEDRLHKLFSTEYPTGRVPKVGVPMEGSNYAVRYFGSVEMYSTLSELINCNMMQSKNRGYKGIFLIDRRSELRATDDCLDVSRTRLKESFIIDAPVMTHGYQAYYNDCPFVKPIRMTKGETLTVVWKKNGFKDVRTETVIESRDTKIKTVTEADERILIGLEDFLINDEGGLVDNNKLTIKVVIYEVNAKMNVAVPVSQLSNCVVTVSGKGYKPFRGQEDLRKRPVRIRLEEDSFVYKCRIPLDVKTGVKAKCTAEIESNVPLKRTPIKGYHSERGFYSGDTIDLHYESPINYKKIIVLACISFLIGIIIGAGSVGLIDKNQISSLNSQVDSLNSQVDSLKTLLYDQMLNGNNGGNPGSDSNDGSIKSAANYLDKTQQWNKTEMDKYNELKGVWDELNKYDYDKLKNRTGLLNESKNFKKIVDLLCTLKEKKLPGGLNNQSYCGDNDLNITYKKYLTKLNKILQNATTTNGSQNAGMYEEEKNM